MKTKARLLFAIAFCLNTSTSLVAAPLGSAFVYQGRLAELGAPAHGNFDLRFRLYDAATDGNQIGSTITSANLPVTDGVFGTSLEFGGGAFEGSARWLDIGVRRAGVGDYTQLTPRQPLAPAPYALFAAEAAAAATAIVAGTASLASSVAPNSVTAAAIQNAAITAEKLADDSVITAKLADGAVGSDALANGSVTLSKLDSGGAAAGQALFFDGTSLVWQKPIGDITDVLAGDGLSGGGNGGAVTLSLAFGGSGNALTAAHSDHNHDATYASVVHTHSGSDIASGVIAPARIDASIARLNQIMSTVLANDGGGSGLNADVLDGKDSKDFASADHHHLGEKWLGVNNPLLITGAFGGGAPTNAPLVLANATGTGLLVQQTGGPGLTIGDAGTSGLLIRTTASDGIVLSTVGRHGMLVSSAQQNGLNVVSAGADGVYVSSADDEGFQVDSAGGDGVQVGSAVGHGVSASSSSATRYGGRFLNSAAAGAALYARSGSSTAPDLVLGGNGSSTAAGVISSDPAYSQSSISLVSQGSVTVHLDDDGSDPHDVSFRILNNFGGNPSLFVNDDGLVQVGRRLNVFGRGSFDDGAFLGNDSFVNGDLDVAGSKSAVVTTSTHGRRRLYAVESPQCWFEDFGTAALIEGVATVTFEPIFAETVNLAERYQVFVTPLGDVALYVSEKTETAFTVRTLGGQRSNVSFDYRIVAKRRGYETVRLESVAGP